MLSAPIDRMPGNTKVLSKEAANHDRRSITGRFCQSTMDLAIHESANI
jgi:hypothetical protein